MAKDWTRREVLKATAAAGIVSGANGLPGMRGRMLAQTAVRTSGSADDLEIERLAGLINDTAPDRVVDVVFEELRKGLTPQRFLGANLIGGIRYHGHHSAYVAHPVNVVSSIVPSDLRMLPLFYHVSVLRFVRGKPRLSPLDKSNLPAANSADEFFRAAMAENDRDTAARALLSIAREQGPRRAFDRLWMYAAERNHASGGHTAISVVNTFRTLESIDWKCLEAALQFAVQDEACRPPKGSSLHAVNRERAARVTEFQPHWSGSQSDRAAVLELLALYRHGRPEEACATTFDLLARGKIQAGTAWDAVFLTTAELVTRYQWSGPNMLAGHSVTCTNALHFMFRIVDHPATRLYALLEAVEWTTSFLNREAVRPALRDRSIVNIEPVELPPDEEFLPHVFSLLPPRRFFDFSRASLGDVDRAMALTMAWARRHPDHEPFIQYALRLLCQKATPEVHDFKYPIALLENYRYASPEWRPHLLAAAVYVLHGSEMEDSPIVAQARERLEA